MTNRALILYATSTGNTAKVAGTFQQVLEGYDWAVDAVRLEPDTDLRRQGIFVDDYSLLLVGSPVISSGPAPLIAKKMALVDIDSPRLYRNELIFPGSFCHPENRPLGVGFVTYSGETYGPCEAEPALSTLEMHLRYLSIPTIGKFACPGRKASKTTIDLIASELRISPAETANLVGQFERAPKDPVFLEMSEDVQALLQQAVLDKHGGMPVPPPEEFSEAVWHLGLDSRPSRRDLDKARIFLSEILEDYFYEDGSPKPAMSVYTCIG